MLEIATIVDTGDLWQMVAAALVGGVGTVAIFSLAILGAVRFAETSRDGRTLQSALFAGLAVLGLVAATATIVTGVVLMTTK
jgi:hypothetical protein